jgi:L-serine dehydratase
MRAAVRFSEGLRNQGLQEQVESVRAELYGSLGTTGKGHGSDKAVPLWLEGEYPDTVDTTAVEARLAVIRGSGILKLLGEKSIRIVEKEYLAMIRKPLPYHPNGMIMCAFD